MNLLLNLLTSLAYVGPRRPEPGLANDRL
eukprot:COSAG06_NODE_16310_length_1008_cov_0.961496_1_plen_28_part_10